MERNSRISESLTLQMAGYFHTKIRRGGGAPVPTPLLQRQHSNEQTFLQHVTYHLLPPSQRALLKIASLAILRKTLGEGGKK